jgi:hypothetical protein
MPGRAVSAEMGEQFDRVRSPHADLNLSDDVIGYTGAPAIALDYPWTRRIRRGRSSSDGHIP